MKCILTVDTEADNQWHRTDATTVENVRALPRFQALCEKFNIRPTYLSTYEVITDPIAASMLKEWHTSGVAEVGAHLHPWTTAPFFPEESGTSFPNELSDHSLREKLTTLTNVLTDVLGTAPRSYRAGRWGFDERQAVLLKELGYTIDLSVTPGLSWKETKGLVGGSGGPDFTGESAMPHTLPSGILEVPMTILKSGLLRRRRWLRIFPNTTAGHLRSVIHAALKEKLPAVVFMIHSSELMAGQSPYVADAVALERVYDRLVDLFALLTKEGIESVTAHEFAQTWQ